MPNLYAFDDSPKCGTRRGDGTANCCELNKLSDQILLGSSPNAKSCMAWYHLTKMADTSCYLMEFTFVDEKRKSVFVLTTVEGIFSLFSARFLFGLFVCLFVFFLFFLCCSFFFFCLRFSLRDVHVKHKEECFIRYPNTKKCLDI